MDNNNNNHKILTTGLFFLSRTVKQITAKMRGNILPSDSKLAPELINNKLVRIVIGPYLQLLSLGPVQ